MWGIAECELPPCDDGPDVELPPDDGDFGPLRPDLATASQTHIFRALLG